MYDANLAKLNNMKLIHTKNENYKDNYSDNYINVQATNENVIISTQSLNAWQVEWILIGCQCF